MNPLEDASTRFGKYVTKDIREKLERINQSLAGRVVSAKDLEKHREERKKSIGEFIEGVYEETGHGPCFTRTTLHPNGSAYGNRVLPNPKDYNPSSIAGLARDEAFLDLDPKEFLFLDTETTGLAGGSGTFAFLVGVGFWEPDGFRVVQYFMRDYDEEPALLEMLRDRLAQFEALVTFNGKSYDLPLLTTRFIQNRMPTILEAYPHLDLLHVSRRLWRRRIGSCSLGDVEKVILGVERENDVPGSEIPEIYFRYVRGGDPAYLVPVFLHNEADVLSMVGIASEAGRLYAKPPKAEEVHPLDLFSIAHVLATDGATEAAEEALREARSADLEPELRRMVLRNLSIICKRSQRWDEALELWTELGELEGVLDVFAFEETAKYFEHHKKSPDLALEIVGRLCAAVETGRPIRFGDYSGPEKAKEALAKRMARLKTKCERKDSNPSRDD